MPPKTWNYGTLHNHSRSSEETVRDEGMLREWDGLRGQRGMEEGREEIKEKQGNRWEDKCKVEVSAYARDGI